MANELDELMDLDPLSLSAQNIDAIIAYHRKTRAQWESGVKPTKDSTNKPSLAGLIKKSMPEKPVEERIKRRF